MRSIILAAVAAITVYSGAFAQSNLRTSGTCNVSQATYDAAKDQFVGKWAIISKQGILTGQGQTMILAPMADTDTVTMVMDGAKLMGSSAMVRAAYELEYFQGPAWPLILDAANPVTLAGVLNPANAAIVASCGANNLLRVTAVNTVTDPGSGMQVDFMVHLFVVHMDLMYGTTQGDIGPMTAKRILVMRR